MVSTWKRKRKRKGYLCAITYILQLQLHVPGRSSWCRCHRAKWILKKGVEFPLIGLMMKLVIVVTTSIIVGTAISISVISISNHLNYHIMTLF